MLWLTRFAIMLAFVVVVLGAFTRLTEAGLGCPDWPGCYGFLTVPTAEQFDTAHARFPEQPVEVDKAWNEMIHRYFAGTLGLVILALAVLGRRKAPIHTGSLLLLVIFQAILGMLTVTMDLKPIIVMGHLLGGFSIFVLLALLERRLAHQQAPTTNSTLNKTTLHFFTACAACLLITQIALGGWTAANYAALACTQLPICEGDWQNKLNFVQAFSPTPQAETYQYGVLDYAARMTIHVSHRVMAIVVAVSLLLYCVMLLKTRVFAKNALVIMVLLSGQVLLGIGNVLLSLPLAIAVAHNAGGLLLLTSLIVTWYQIYQLQDAKSKESIRANILVSVKELS
ncbi:cytochrome oxidase assembly [Catenovulum agarivorans DS-2]|uniref:Cytochrome oxidase assembly n=1 Tax=Catenovulum agarivorans DS-2 TaxID=1328313 RepID=W7QKU3_9ALTE|nr:COX15/CtaA family protein [Catenovulum agarivorans]EWH08698.1 cytochrome oxidase assembly [Catenovulum agarivorans DS-2]